METKNINKEYKGLTPQAIKILENLDGKVFSVKEELTHDGYDSYGPESDIWILEIIYYKNNKQIISKYGREIWYTHNYYEEEYMPF